MKIGERVRHIRRKDLGVGAVTEVYTGNTFKVEFKNDCFTGISPKLLVSVEAEILEQDRRKLKSRFVELILSEGLVHAETFFHKECVGWWDKLDYEATKGQALLELEKQRIIDRENKLKIEREPIRNRVILLLSQGMTKKADELYIASCQLWWPKSEYSNIRQEEILVGRFLDVYRNGSLSQLDEFYRNQLQTKLPVKDFVALKKPRLKHLLSTHGQNLDEEQFEACARPESRLLVRARAGSGKTRTLCVKAAMIIQDEGLNPDQVLILAFNRSAAREVANRMKKEFGCPSFQTARTFHSLAYKLAKSNRKLLFDSGGHLSQREQSIFVQKLLERIINPAFKKLLYQFFRAEISEIETLGRDLSPEEYRVFRRSLDQVSLSGDRVKSAGEKFIADFLFEHAIPYKYEEIWDWGGLNKRHPYKPDFSIVVHGTDFILEHWALDPDATHIQLPEDWTITASEYRQQILRKRAFWKAKGITLIETNVGELSDGRVAFETVLKQRLQTAGIHCKKLPGEEIVKRVFETEFQLSRMARQFLQFIQRAKKRCLTVREVDKLVASRDSDNERLKLFYHLAIRVYREYENRLNDLEAIDFDDLLREATRNVESQGENATIFLDNERFIRIGEIKWLLVDEYQDFTELYYRMLSAILKVNPSIRLLAVGDNWQAINGFSGADLRFFDRFSEYFPGAGEVTIRTNYRSSRTVVGCGNHLMTGQGPQAHPRTTAPIGNARVFDITSEWIEFRWEPSREKERQQDAVFLPRLKRGQMPKPADLKRAKVLKCCAKLFQQTKSGKLLLVSRMRRVYGLELNELRDRLVEVVAALTEQNPKELDQKIRVMTVHTAKGQEEESVVVLDASHSNFPKIHPDNLLYEIFDVTPAKVLNEERRLFYVAITRAMDNLSILVEDKDGTLYLDAIKQRSPNDIEIRAVNSSSKHQQSDIFRKIKERIKSLPAA